MERLTDTEISRALTDMGIETTDDPRPMREIGRQFGIIPVAAEIVLEPTQETSD